MRSLQPFFPQPAARRALELSQEQALQNVHCFGSDRDGAIGGTA